jgi:DNA polymerase (family 10)
MPVHNKEIVNMLNELADLLDIKGENQFRVRAYRNAVRSLSGFTRNISDLLDDEEAISAIPGIGDSMVDKIKEIVETGKLGQLEQIRKEVPSSLLDIMKLQQMGPQRTKVLYDELSVTSIDELKHAAEKGLLVKLKGFGEKTSDKILQEIKNFEQHGGPVRIRWSEAKEFVVPLVDYLNDKLDQVTIAGSYRRKKETVGDIDIVGLSNDPDQAMDDFVNYGEARQVLAKGSTRSSIVLRTGLQVDLRIVEKEAFGAALLYFTGSKEHSIALRKIAQENGHKLNEYGVYKNKKRLAGKTEAEMYKALGLRYIEPELREDKGEFEASANNSLPKLVKLEDIKGDLHTHTNATDGKYSMEEMVAAAEKLGYSYYSISDHSKRVAMARGLNEKRLAEQIKQIDKLNGKLKNIKVLKSIEVDILEDGKLDLPNRILKELDVVVCSVHYNQNLPKDKQTARVLKAMQNPYFNILGHPTGRLIGVRSSYDIDMERIMLEAKMNGCFLEINASPDRLDLNDDHARMAKEMGVKISISTDAHSIDGLNYMAFGVAQARRGWLEKDDVLNTRPWEELKVLLKR